MSIPPPHGPSYPQPYPPSGPYGGQPGWYPPPKKTNALAIVAFVMALVCAVPTVPLILGVIALSQIRSRGENGRGLAIAAVVVHGVTLVFYVLVLVLGLSGALDDGPPARRDTTGGITAPGSSDVEDIRKGDCFNTDDDLTEYQDQDGGRAAMSVRVVPCDQPHEGEAYAVFDLADGAYPGTDKVVAIAEERCGGKALTDYVGDAANLSEDLEVYYYYPQPGTWVLGDREVTCFLGNVDGSTTGSARGTGSSGSTGSTGSTGSSGSTGTIGA
ncbi:DUF4190 domain-containing protein [Streptomyces sp. NPDC012888]|uniref:DUF4190 domain-containing protein n=1 Tax=Streptomyces sp. NPDC012888 TaxID=3364855 RepID=UPI0036B671A0